MKDILDVPRVNDIGDQYVNPNTTKRMVQDYRRCEQDCLDDRGHPRDMFNSGGDYTRLVSPGTANKRCATE